MDISIKCTCGRQMVKIEDGREYHTLHFCKHYPKDQMEFVCWCGRSVDLRYTESWMESSLIDAAEKIATGKEVQDDG